MSKRRIQINVVSTVDVRDRLNEIQDKTGLTRAEVIERLVMQAELKESVAYTL